MLENATAHTYPVILASHLPLDYLSGPQGRLQLLALFPDGYGQNATAFKVHEIGSVSGWVEFHVNKAKGEVEGFSLVGDQEACASRGRNTGGVLRETADAWFPTVQSSKYSTGGLPRYSYV